ncbi:MAG: hypothetical protein H7Y18_06230 [Clostridiaceae bacterium]|nr:hypothetical protein [Clostridiaceae bacterium]
MNTSEKLHEIKNLLSDKGDTRYEDYLDKVFNCMDCEFDTFVYQQLELVLTQFWNNKNNLDETMEKIEDLISSHNGKKYQERLGMVRYEFDRNKFYKNNKYILYIICIPLMLCVLRMIYIKLYMGDRSTFSSWLIPFIIVIVSTMFIPYLFTYNAKKAKYKTNFIEIKNNICIYDKAQSASIEAGLERRMYYLNKVSKIDSNSKYVFLYGEIEVIKHTEGSKKVEPYKTINKLKIPNYYKNIDEVITFISSKIIKD